MAVVSKPSTNDPQIVLISYALAAAALAVAYSTHGSISITLLGRPRDEIAKPFTDVNSFYEFYLQEHRDPICRILHWIGTTLASIAIWRNGVLPHLLLGISFGFVACEFLSPLPNGSVEMVCVLTIAALSFRIQTTKSFPWQVLIWGYLPAWIGHFFFEHNRPATFIYPTYSLLSDYKMWLQVVTGTLPWNERL